MSIRVLMEEGQSDTTKRGRRIEDMEGLGVGTRSESVSWDRR